MQTKFSVSLMCMDFLRLKEQIEILNPLCDAFHIDIMDGHFVKNITLSPDFVSAAAKIAKKPLECHLMVTEPAQYLDALQKAGADLISPQAETMERDAFRLLTEITDRGMQCGVTVCPATPLLSIAPYLGRLKKVTLMTVDPGFAGQRFIPEMLPKIKALQEMKQQSGCDFEIEVDGSCNEKTFGVLKQAGAEVLVVGTSGLFGLDRDLEKAYAKMRRNFERAECK